MIARHPVSLLADTQGMNGYEFAEWMSQLSEDEFKLLDKMSYSLSESIKREREQRLNK